jgi:hypothetical protein
MVVKALRVAAHGTSATAACKYEYESDAVETNASGSVIPDVEVTVEAVDDKAGLERGEPASNNCCCSSSITAETKASAIEQKKTAAKTP